jgi:cell fate regulator YaaT (PSP1 superfamily)
MRNSTIEKANRVIELTKRGMGVNEACEKANISYATFYNFKKKKPKHTNTKDLFVIPAQTNSDSATVEKLKEENAALRKFIKDFL